MIEKDEEGPFDAEITLTKREFENHIQNAMDSVIDDVLKQIKNTQILDPRQKANFTIELLNCLTTRGKLKSKS